MTYILILFIYSSGSGKMSIESVPGFKTEKACYAAVAEFKQRTERIGGFLKYSFVCAKDQ